MAVLNTEKMQAYLTDLAKHLASGAALKVGFLAGATYPDGTSVATVAAIQNFGAPAAGIPPRPFFNRAIEQHSEEWGKLLAFILPKVAFDAEKALGIVGERIAGDIRQAIVDQMDPPLAPATIARRVARSTGPANPSSIAKPLVDTGVMLAAVAYEVSLGDVSQKYAWSGGAFVPS